MTLLPAELKEHVTSYLSPRDQKSLLQTEFQQRAFFEGRASGGIKAVADSANAEFAKFFNELLRSPPDEMQVLLASRTDVVMPAELEITKLLVHVVKGDIEHTEAILEQYPELLLRKGRVMDFSERRFVGEGITAFQYALAAQDRPMTQMLLQYFPKTEERDAAVAWQYAETAAMLKNPKIENHQAVKSLNASIDDVHQKLGVYLMKYKDMSYQEFQRNEVAAKPDWCVVVGGAYRKVPAWVIETMCEKGENVAWVKDDLTLPVKRDCKYLVWLADNEGYGGRSGAAWAPSRGSDERPWQLYSLAVCQESSGEFDHGLLTSCQSVRPGELPKLESLYSGDELRSTLPSGPARQ